MNNLIVVRGFIGFVFLLLCSSAWSQNDFNQSFEQFTQGQQESFNQFVEQNDRVFINMLKQNWKEFKEMPPLVRDPIPKPKRVPKHETSPPVDSRNVIKAGIKKKLSEISTPKEKTATDSFSFFGNHIQLPQIQVVRLTSYTEAGLRKYWEQSVQVEHRHLLNGLSTYKNKLKLSDWAYWLLVKKYTEQFRDNPQERVVLAWLILSKSGYNVRVALNSQSVLLLMSSRQTLFEVPYFEIQGQRFYRLEGKTKGSVKTYHGDYNVMNTALDMRFNKSLNTKPSIRYRNISYKTNGKQHNLQLPYDFQRVRYFSTYPQLDLKYYNKAPVGSISEKGLKDNIHKLLMGNSEKKLNQLLRFIHIAFPYAVDKEQFGKENYLLLEETLHYQASDCEDRSVLFAWLARNLLGEKVVLLQYPGHVSAAIEQKGKMISADATYIGARLGDVMPKYAGVKSIKIIH